MNVKLQNLNNKKQIVQLYITKHIFQKKIYKCSVGGWKHIQYYKLSIMVYNLLSLLNHYEIGSPHCYKHFYEMNKDKNNGYSSKDEKKTMRLQPYTQNYRQQRDTESKRNTVL